MLAIINVSENIITGAARYHPVRGWQGGEQEEEEYRPDQRGEDFFLILPVGYSLPMFRFPQVNSGGNINYIIITCEEDIHLITDVLKAKLGVYTPEFVLKAVMRVEMDFELSQYLTTHRD